MKPPKNIDEMVELFKNRNLKIDDEQVFRRFLYNNNYYRVSGYFRVFQVDPAHGNDDFKNGTVDRDFVTPYVLDAKLRELILRGTSTLEIFIRSCLAYELSQDDNHAYDYTTLSAYMDTPNLKRKNRQEKLTKNIQAWLDRSSEIYIKHYKATGELIPIWVAVEALPFDTISKILLEHRDAHALRRVYKALGLSKSLTAGANTVHAMVYLRNLCAHHARLWKRETVISVPFNRFAMEKYNVECKAKSILSSLLTLMYMVDFINETDEYSQKILSFLANNCVYADGIAVPERWS